MHLGKSGRKLRDKRICEENVPPSVRSPINVELFQKHLFNVLYNGSLVVGAGGTQDSQNIGKEGKSTRDVLKVIM